MYAEMYINLWSELVTNDTVLQDSVTAVDMIQLQNNKFGTHRQTMKGY